MTDAHPRRCTSHSMRRADPAKGSARKCDRLKVAGCLGCELGLKELKAMPALWTSASTITGRCVWWCENESDAVVSSGDHRSRRERGGITGVGRGAWHGWWLVSDRPRHATLPAPPLSPPRTCPTSMLNYTVWTAGFCPVSGSFCINW